MKKILLASTMLAGTAGFAAADVSFSGSAYTGVGYNITTGTANIDYSIVLVTSMSTTTDGGLEVGASFVTVPVAYTLQKAPDDAEFGTIDSPTVSGLVTNLAVASNIYAAGSWGRVDIAWDINADDAASTPGDWDLTATYSNTWGNFGLEVYGVYAPAPVSTATTNGDFGAMASYTFGDYMVYGGVDYDNSDTDGNKIDVYAGIEASISGFTAAAEVSFDIGSGYYAEGSLGYETGPYSISAFVNTDIEYGIEAGYDLGGGVGLEAGFAHSNGVNSAAGNVVWAGVSMAF